MERAVAEAVAQARPECMILVEGFLLFSHDALLPYYRSIIALEAPIHVFKERRMRRDEWLRENEIYWDQVILPAFNAYGTIPVLAHCNHLTVDAQRSMEELHSEIFEQIETWRKV